MNFLYDWKTSAIQLSIVMASFFLGKFGYSINWMSILITTNLKIIEMKNKRLKQTVTEVSSKNMSDEELILLRFHEIPGWVKFPDFERSEWLNRIIRKFWPFVEDKVDQLIKEFGSLTENLKIIEAKIGKNVMKNLKALKSS